MKRLIFCMLSAAVLTFSSLSYAQGSSNKTYETGQQWIEEIQGNLNNLDTEQLLKLIEDNPNLEFIDVRTDDEIAHTGGLIKAGRRTHAINRGWLEFQIGETVSDLSTTLVVYCGTNLRSPLAADTLQKMGYQNVFNYTDGFPAWQSAGHRVEASDAEVGSMLYQKPIQVTPRVWSAIGATAPATLENSGHNNNLSFIVGDESVLVVNASDNYLLASSLHNEIKKITELPVTHVVLENGQGHAMLGMNYWQEQGAEIIAHVDTVDVIEERGELSLGRMRARNRDKSMGTELAAADITFEDSYPLNLGGIDVEIMYLGPSHSPGDTQVWIPESKLMIAGDMAFHERLLPVFDDSDTAGWIETWDDFKALSPEIVIPGHGHPTTIDVVETWTIGYLEFIREEVGKILDEGGSLIEAYNIDQSAYSHLDTFDELAGLNVDRIYRAMEFE